MFLGTILITIMYLGLTYSIAEMSPALPHTGGAYSFARTAFGPWGGFITGVAENIEYVLTPAVIVYFIGTYLTAIFDTPSAFQPVYWILGYILFVSLNMRGVELSFMITVMMTLLAIGVLVTFVVGAIPFFDFGKYALNIGADPVTGAAVELPEGNGPFLPFGVYGILAAMPFAVWLFLAIEQLPLAAEESTDPKRDMPKGIMYGMFTLIALGFRVLIFNPAIPIPRQVTDAAGAVTTVHGAFALGTSGEPILDGFRVIFESTTAGALALVAVTGLVASFHAIIFAYGRQIYSLSRAGYFPHFLSVTHGTHKTPNVALIAGGVLGLAVMLVVWFAMGGEAAGSVIGGVLLNMAVFGAMFSYLLQGSLHPAAAEVPEYRAPLSQPVRRGRRGADRDHRACNHRLPARRSRLSHRRGRRGDLVRARDPLFRGAWAEDAHPLARGGVRGEASREPRLNLTPTGAEATIFNEIWRRGTPEISRNKSPPASRSKFGRGGMAKLKRDPREEA
jgi:ethanolamine permease